MAAAADKLEQAILDGRPLDRGERSSDELERTEEDDMTLAFRPPTSTGGPALRGKRGEASRTGPKGVLADWRASSKAHAHEQPIYDRADARKRTPPLSKTPALSSSPSSSDELDEVDSEAERMAVERYRRQRMDELARTGGSGKVFGHLREIGVEQFEDAVLQEDENVKVVLHLYEPHIPACAILSSHLSSLARTYPQTKFLRAIASHLDFAVNDADDVLPTLLVYQAGELDEKLIAIDREWGQRTSVREDEVKAVLTKHGVLTTAPAMSRQTSSASKGDDSE